MILRDARMACMAVAGSTERSKQAKACYDVAQHMVQSKPGGCCTAVPLQTALLFAEDQACPCETKQQLLQHTSTVRV